MKGRFHNTIHMQPPKNISVGRRKKIVGVCRGHLAKACQHDSKYTLPIGNSLVLISLPFARKEVNKALINGSGRGGIYCSSY